MITHLALIMDGNRRWAKSRGLFPWLGHHQGVNTVEMVMQYCLEQNISILSLYTLSLENFQRSQTELSYLFSLIDQAQSRVQEFIKEDIKIRFVGDRAKIPPSINQTCEKIEEQTAGGKRLLCNLLFGYGSQQEVSAAVNMSISQHDSAVSMEQFRTKLWLGAIADPEVIIRTGGVKRLSNFLLFQAAYCEIRFLDCLWPDLSKDLLHATVLDCLASQKNFGK